MPVMIYTGGKSPFTDIGAFVQKIKQRQPEITDLGINQTVKRAIGLMKPRNKKYVVALFGRDIMSETVEQEWFWPYLAGRQKQRILAHPINGGAVLTGDDSKERKIELLNSMNHGEINRSVLINARGDEQMSRTYVFSTRTQWEQDMTDADRSLLLSFPQLRRLFVDGESFLGYHPIQSYSHIPVRERHIARDGSDVRALQREFARPQRWNGADTKQG